MATMDNVLRYSLLLLSVGSMYSQEADSIIRIRLEQPEYTFTEGQGPWCVDVRTVNGPAPQNFPVDYMLLSPSIGGDESRPFVLQFWMNNSVQNLCIEVYDNEDTCESDAVGKVELLNGTIIQAVEITTASIFVKDDDPVTVSFAEPEYTFAEGSGMQWVPLLLGTEIPSNINLLITTERKHREFLENSLATFTKTITLESPEMPGAGIQLEVHDDHVALEDPEMITMTITVVEKPCDLVEITPFSQTTILIPDDDVVHIEMIEDVIVGENETTVEVCAQVSHKVARPLTLIFTTRDESATGGNDYIGGTFTKQVEAFSLALVSCVQLQIEADGFVENTETFVINLDFNCSTEQEKSEFEGRLTVGKAFARVSIKDSSQCTSLTLTAAQDKAPVYVPPESTVCFVCKFHNVGSGGNVTWTLDGETVAPNDGEVLDDGTLMIRDSSQVFDSKSSTLACGNKELHNFTAFLGAVPEIVKLEASTSIVQGTVTLSVTCEFEGLPTPTITWLFEGKSFAGEEKIETGNSSSVLSSLDAEDGHVGYYSCVAENEFGNSSDTIQVHKDPVKESQHSASGKVNFEVFVLLMCITFATVLGNKYT